MKNSFQFLCLFAIAAVLGCSHTIVTPQTHDGPTSEAAMSLIMKDEFGRFVSVKVSKLRLDEGFPLRSGWLWGAESLPVIASTEIDVTYDGKRIFIPLSAFVDLAGIGMIGLSFTDQGFCLEITGGDAAVSYRAKLFFSHDRLLYRRVESGEFPRDVWEETTYSFHSRDEF